MAQKQGGFLSLDDAVKKLGLTRPEIYRRVGDKVLMGEKRGRSLCFESEEIRRYSDVLEQERGQVQEAVDRWLSHFAGRLKNRSWADLQDVAGRPVGEQVAEIGERILQDALGEGARDVYFDPLYAGSRLLYSAGRCREVARLDACLSEPLGSWLRGMISPGDSGREQREGMARKTWGEAGCQLRLTEVSTSLGSHFHLHFFTDYEGADLGSLGYTPLQAEHLRRGFEGRPGLFLVVGSGVPEDERHRLVLAKEWADSGRLVVCLDHRTGYRGDQLVQLEVGNGTGSEFQTVWQVALDMSPDVLVVDEVRDAEQANALLEGVRSGAVVLAQVRASGMADAVRKLLDLEIDRADFGGPCWGQRKGRRATVVPPMRRKAALACGGGGTARGGSRR